MFAYLRGALAEINLGKVVLDVNGVGYMVNVPTSVISQLPHLGEQIKMFVHLVVKEDAQDLYGFLDESSKSIFEKLISVSGIGPKAAISTLSALTPERIVLAVASGDEKILSSVPGIGKKTAQRVVLELKDKLKGSNKEGDNFSPALFSVGTTKENETVQALLALGYELSESYTVVKSVYDDKLDLQTLVKNALKVMDKR